MKPSQGTDTNQSTSRDRGGVLDTTFLRFVAILLITNSHLDNLYPTPALSTGGQLGNSLFFMLSGYGLVASHRGKGDAFLPWLRRRLSRIYPSVWLVALAAAAITGTVHEWNVSDYVRHLLWPTEYWFVAAIVCFYVPFYWLMRLGSKAAFLLPIGLSMLPYFYFYFTALDLSRFSIEDGYFKWIFYFQVMLLGGFLACRDVITRPIASQGWNTAALALLVALYFGVKLLVAKGLATEIQFLIHWLTFPIMVSSLIAIESRLVRETIMKSAAAPFIALVAGATLEIYLLQKYIYGHEFVLSIPFPGNVAIFWPMVILGGILIARVATKGVRLLATRARLPLTSAGANGEGR